MSKKEIFIEYVENLMKSNEPPEDAKLYFEALKAGKQKVDKPLFTENGAKILQYMQDNLETKLFKSKDIAEGLVISSRSVSGAMRKLVTDGFVEKMGQDPIIYSITEKGKEINIKGE